MLENSQSFRAYERAVIGSDRARYTFRKRLNAINELARGFDGKRILDIGCGYGFRTIGVAGNGASSVNAIDLDAERIEAAVRYARKRKVENVHYCVMNAECLEFENDSFDLVLADELVHHLADVPKVLQEMQRVLKTGGAAIISDHNRLSLFSEIVRTIYFGNQKERVFTAMEVKQFFEEAGFHDIVWKHTIFTMPFAGAPRILFKINFLIESFIESTPILQTQCGIFVIRGKK